jgi:hypothetical protein
MELANLSRAGSCKSWVAIFFESHRPIFRRDEAMDRAWSDAADIRNARDVLNPPKTVIVHLWYDVNDAYLIPLAESATENIFGKRNRGGLTFDWREHGGTFPTTCPGDIPGLEIEYQVCYSSKTGPSLPQLLGQKWGLHLLAGPELSNPVYTDNVMHPTMARDRLTLGQMFRVHTALPTDDFPNCMYEPCPPLDTDVGP